MLRGFDNGPSLPADIVRHVHSTPPLEQPLIWQSFLVVAVLAALGRCYYRSSRRRRRQCVVTAVIAALLVAVTGLNSYVGYVRTPHDLARLLRRGPTWTQALSLALDPSGGHGVDPQGAPDETVARRQLAAARDSDHGIAVRRVSLPDPALAVPTGVTNVMLPPGYDDPANARRRYPVVYLVHGYPYGSSSDWFTAGAAVSTMRLLLSHHEVPPMIVVGVDMTAGSPSTDWECLDVPHGPQLETYLTSFVVPQVDHRFRTLPDRWARALGGMSGGAFCALNIGLHHTNEFSVLLMTEPYDTLGSDKSLLRGNRALVRVNTPRKYIRTMTFHAPVATMLDVPTGSFSDIATGERIATALRGRGLEVALRKEYGFNHTWHTARAALPFLLKYASEHFGGVSPVRAVHDTSRRSSTASDHSR